MPDFVCPFCGLNRFWKNGFNRGKQRYKCFECNQKTYSHYPIDYNLNSKEHNQNKKFDFHDDVWIVKQLFVSVADNEIITQLNFSSIKTEWFKNIVKRYIRQKAVTGNSVAYSSTKLRILRHLSNLLDERQIHNIESISRELIFDFISKLGKGKSNKTVVEYWSNLKDFFDTGNIHGWFKVSEHLITVNDYPKYSTGKPNDIPSNVLKQIEDNLHQLPDPIATMWIVGYFCAMRISEIQLCQLDCLTQDSRGRWNITFWRKKTKDWHTLPISRDLTQVIQEQQNYIKELFGESFNYLFCDFLQFSKQDFRQPNMIPEPRCVRHHILSDCINSLIESENIKDDNGKLWHFTNHQLRDTRLTYLFETGHEFTVVSKWAGHKKHYTTQKYVHVKDHTLREETASIQAALLNIRGELLNPKDLPETLQSNPNAHTLAIPDDHINTPIYGYCGLSLDSDCPHWKACYTCPSFVARRELLPDYIKVRDLLRDKQTRAEEKGETALIDQFKQQADSLDTVIASFERVA